MSIYNRWLWLLIFNRIIERYKHIIKFYMDKKMKIHYEAAREELVITSNSL